MSCLDRSETNISPVFTGLRLTYFRSWQVWDWCISCLDRSEPDMPADLTNVVIFLLSIEEVLSFANWHTDTPHVLWPSPMLRWHVVSPLFHSRGHHSASLLQLTPQVFSVKCLSHFFKLLIRYIPFKQDQQ